MSNDHFSNIDNFQSDFYDYSVISEAFRYIVKSTSIDFRYQQGGCQQRSHLISLVLMKNFEIIPAKAWLFAPITVKEGDLTTLEVKDKNNLTGDHLIHWNYHTAPVIGSITNGQKRLLVIDPVLDIRKPLELKKWLQLIGNSNLSYLKFTTSSDYFFNCKYNESNVLTNIFDGSFFDYSNPAKDNLAMEKGLAANDTAMKIYKKYIKPLNKNTLNNNKKILQDLKEIFGNASALDFLIAQNISAGTECTSYRYVLTNYANIILEAKQFFQKRLLYWTDYTNKLI